ncbi:MAG: type III-B CRISPR-associated protein Cas10/Cmr2 [Acetobacteraceae bacterium]
MSTGGHLLLIALGPVQDFIAQARRMRDLWFGSHLLSELSRAGAAALAEAGATLIFPAMDRGDAELAKCNPPIRPETQRPPVSVANKILAKIPPEQNPATCAAAVRGKVLERWREIADEARDKPHVRAVLADNADPVWQEQIEDVLEFYAVWAPIAGSYGQVRETVEKMLTGRKSLRDFRVWQHDLPGMPKSSLDGARLSVLKPGRRGPAFGRLGIRAGEQLDAIGLIKRAGFGPEQFVPVVNVAAGHWLRMAQAEEKSAATLATLRDACKHRSIHHVRRSLPVVEPLPFDASVLYPSRWASLFKELDEPADAADARQWGEAHVRPLLRAMRGEPPAYVACLVADGDNMGKAIDRLDSIEDNQAFSRGLAKFPEQAHDIVGRHLGSLIYAGGDDVLAFLPVATALECAAELAGAFAMLMASVVPSGPVPTLSVGIGIGHLMEPMGMLLNLGRDAEHTAKRVDGKNALAVLIDKRSGGQRPLVLPWPSDPLPRLRQDAALLRGPLSTGKMHALEALVRRFPDPAAVADQRTAEQALAAYARDLLMHTGEAEAVSPEQLAIDMTGNYASIRTSLQDTVHRVLAVRTMCEAGFR